MNTITLKAWAVYVGTCETGFPCAMFHYEQEARMYATFAMTGLKPRVEQITFSTPRPEWACEMKAMPV